jgi:hypothetical protein
MTERWAREAIGKLISRKLILAPRRGANGTL